MRSTGWSPLTSVKELSSIFKIPYNKIVIGKPAAPEYARNTGYVSPDRIEIWLRDLYHKTGWKTGMTFWQFRVGNGEDDGIAVAERALRLLLNVVGDAETEEKERDIKE